MNVMAYPLARLLLQQGPARAEAVEMRPRMWRVSYPTGGETLFGTTAQVEKAMRRRLAVDSPDAVVLVKSNAA